MKKIICAALTAAMITAAFTGCDSLGNSSGNSSGASPENSSAGSSDGGGSGNSAGDASGAESSNGDLSSDDSGEELEGADNSGLEYPDNRAGEMVKAALSAKAWGDMELITEQDSVNILISENLKLDMCEEYCLAHNLISSQLYNVFVIKPISGNEDALQSALDEYLNKVKTDPNIVFYPAQEESAAGAVKGETDDGYLYVILHENGADIESAMLA